MSYEVIDEEVPKPLWCQMETLTLPSPALTVTVSIPEPLPGQHSLTNLLCLLKRNQPQTASEVTNTALPQAYNQTALISLGYLYVGHRLLPRSSLEQEAQKKEGTPSLPVPMQATSLQQPRKVPGK